MSVIRIPGGVRTTAFALAVAALSGCFTVHDEPAKNLGKDVEEHVVVSNFGWCLFGIPLVCGNEKLDSWCPVTFFKDEVDPSYGYAKLLARAKAKNCTLDSVEVRYTDDLLCKWLMEFPVPWILPYYESNISAVLVKKGGAK